jgi:hypothetical protein
MPRVAPRSAAITKLPAEILMKIFRIYVGSYPEVRDQRVVDLCLVSRYWNTVANSTPQLWTKINLSFPFTDPHLAAVLKRVHASKLERIDVSIDFCDPLWVWGQPPHDIDLPILTEESIWVQNILSLLRDTEKRWKSIEVVSQTWPPLHELIEGWTFTDLPSLESILMRRENYIFSTRNVDPFDPQPLIEPMTLFGRNASLPRLRDMSLSAVRIDWDDASASYQNLRKLEMNNLAHNVGPSFEQFAAMLSSSPRLEYLDVSGFFPGTEPDPLAGGDPEIPVVHLPALKEFTFGWKNTNFGRNFLQIFQIGRSLENLTLVDTKSGLGRLEDQEMGWQDWDQDSQAIFEALCNLGSGAPQYEGDIPPGPFISMGGIKRLGIVWTKEAGSSLIPFLRMLTELEDVWLEDVSTSVLEDITSVEVEKSRAMGYRPLRIIGWAREKGVPSVTEPSILQLENAGVEVATQAVEDRQAGQEDPGEAGGSSDVQTNGSRLNFRLGAQYFPEWA